MDSLNGEGDHPALSGAGIARRQRRYLLGDIRCIEFPIGDDKAVVRPISEAGGGIDHAGESTGDVFAGLIPTGQCYMELALKAYRGAAARRGIRRTMFMNKCYTVFY